MNNVNLLYCDQIELIQKVMRSNIATNWYN